MLYKAKSLGNEKRTSVNFLRKVLSITMNEEIPITFLKDEDVEMLLGEKKMNQDTLFPMK